MKWLLAIPHYLVLAVFVGGGIWLASRTGDADSSWEASVSLLSLLVCIAAIVLLFTGRYPKPLYDFILGVDRWVLRVAAYTALMTDRYPPFRLDLGGTDPGRVPAGPVPPSPSGVPIGAPPAPPVPAR